MEITKKEEEKGFMLISVIILMSLALLISGGIAASKRTEAKILSTANEESKNYAKVEESMAKTVAWLQENQENLVTAFTDGNFDTNFVHSSPSIGDNESPNFSVPTLIKVRGTTNDSAMLSSNPLFGTSSFPTTTNLTTNASFDPVASFESADLGDANTRIVLVWAQGNGEQPIFRVDTLTGNNPDRGVHSFTYVYSTLDATPAATSGGAGGAAFYSANEDLELKTGNNECYSNKWVYTPGSGGTIGTWSKSTNRSNCILASDQKIKIGADVGGDVLSKGNITLTGGSVSGTICKDDSTCHNNVLPTYDSWDTTCGASNNGDLNVTSNMELPISGNNCWRDITIANNRRLTLVTTGDDPADAYHFRNITFNNKNRSRLEFKTVDNMSKGYTVFIEDYDGGDINGNKFHNQNNPPHMVKLNITGSGDHKLNGTADVAAHITAPDVNFTLQGNFKMYGGIHASGINLTGNARIWADEDLRLSTPGTPASVEGMTFVQTKASQRYRIF